MSAWLRDGAYLGLLFSTEHVTAYACAPGDVGLHYALESKAPGPYGSGPAHVVIEALEFERLLFDGLPVDAGTSTWTSTCTPGLLAMAMTRYDEPWIQVLAREHRACRSTCQTAAGHGCVQFRHSELDALKEGFRTKLPPCGWLPGGFVALGCDCGSPAHEASA